MANEGNQGNKGGEKRGQDRADEVHARNAERQANRPADEDEIETPDEGSEGETTPTA